MSDGALRLSMVGAGRMLHESGLTPGTSGNLSVRHGDGFLLTPGGSRLGNLRPDELALLSHAGGYLRGPPATKEARLHLDVYAARPDATSVVHLHSPYAVAASCLSDLDDEHALPPLTVYSVIRFGAVGLVPFFPPGSPALAQAVRTRAATHRALLLTNHGSLVAGSSLESACADAEELEHAAQVYLLTRGLPTLELPDEFLSEVSQPGAA